MNLEIIKCYSPPGLRLAPCFCIVTCAFKWLRVPYAFVQLGKLERRETAVSTQTETSNEAQKVSQGGAPEPREKRGKKRSLTVPAVDVKGPTHASSLPRQLLHQDRSRGTDEGEDDRSKRQLMEKPTHLH